MIAVVVILTVLIALAPYLIWGVWNLRADVLVEHALTAVIGAVWLGAAAWIASSVVGLFA